MRRNLNLQKTNILYLNSNCNLKCEYCYQLADREKSRLVEPSESEIFDFINEIEKRESGKTSTVVLFGGEPMLNKSKFLRVLEIFNSRSHKYALSTTTNGLAFLDSKFFADYQQAIAALKHPFSLEISYDGVGHSRRVYPSGKSSKNDVEKVLELFNPKDISIRYTIHKGNYNCAIHDIIRLQKYKKIIVNFYESELDDYIDIKAFKERLIRITEYLFTKFKTPVCYLNCEVCRGCNFAEFSGINYNAKIAVDGNAGEFNHFSVLRGLQ